MRCLSQRLECQSGHVGRVPSYCGRTRRRCCRLGRATLTCRSSFYEEVPSTRQVEVSEAVGVVLPLQCERDGTTEIKSHLQSAWRVPVCRGVDRRASTSRLLFGKEWRCSRREEVLAEAQHRRGPSSTAAQPIPEGRERGAAMPRGITGVGLERAPKRFARTSRCMEKPRRRA
ncbi:hypothetical protein TcYC6_0006930 [Trypanosoma cruzi]|nr:hypothetical protein TcYC6_0006930 [Trypanosoma cruzi]